MSECLFDSTEIYVSGWPGIAQYDQLPISSLVARVLCKSHNEALSPIDDEAKRLKTALRDGYGDSPHNLFTKPSLETRAFTINGTLFSRWLAKTYCGRQAQFKYVPEPEFVSHAFGRIPQKPLHFYVATQNGHMPYAYGRYWLKPGQNDSGGAIFCVYFHGIIWYMTNFQITARHLEPEVCWVENPNEVHLMRPIGSSEDLASRIFLEWPIGKPNHVFIYGGPTS